MKRTCLIVLCLLALSCTKDRGWDNPCDPEGIAKPTAPTGLKAVALNDSAIELTWRDSEGEMGYKIERSIDGGPMQEIGNVSRDDSCFVDTALKTDHHYRYQVRAFTANGEETKTDTEFHHMFPAPSDLVLTQISDSETRLQWKDNSVFESGFTIERKEEGGSFSQVGSVGQNVTAYLDKGLHTGKTYIYRIRAFSSTNESASVTQSIQHGFPAPSNLVLTQVSDSEIRLEWQDNSVFESGFRIERKDKGGSYLEVSSVGEDVESYTDGGTFYVGETYTYRVRAFTATNESALATQSIPLVFPAPYNLVFIQVSSSQIRLIWNDNSIFENGFRIERKEGTTGDYVQIATVGPNTQTYADSDVRLGTDYTYRVRAFTALNESASLEANLQHILQAPTYLKATRLTGSSVRLSWTDNSSFEDGFIIERKDGAQGSYVEIGHVGANTTHYTDNVSSYITYTYRVKAYVQDQGSSYSDEVILPPPPEGMVWIPGGTFQMGDHFNEGKDDERPVHTVTVDGFWMDKYEVTNAQYGAYDPSHNGASYLLRLNGDDQPVVYVSWWDTIWYCNWRSRQEGLEVCYNERTGACDFSKNGYRLPTEAEWEYAARGSLEGKRYPWGNEDPVCQEGASNGARFDDKNKCNNIGTAPVGSYSPNGYGLYDMAGNVSEYCSDWYDSGYYSKSPDSNPTGAATVAYRVLRGGSWYSDPYGVRCAVRRRDDLPCLSIGFRCVRSSL